MTFECDAKKALANVRKHGVTFEQAASVFTDPAALTYQDPDHSGAELREITMGHTGQGRLLFVSHCDGGGRMRLISARPATRREQRQYEKGTDFEDG